MSDVMLYGVLRMPYEMAMSNEMSRLQFYGRVQEAVRRMEVAEAKLEELGRATPPSPSTAPIVEDDLNGGMHASIFVKVWGDAGGGDAGRIALANYAYELGRRAALASRPAGEVELSPLPKPWPERMADHYNKDGSKLMRGTGYFKDAEIADWRARAALASKPAAQAANEKGQTNVG